MQTTSPELSLFLNQFHTVCPKIQTKFLGKLGNSKFFSFQNQVVSKKKKVFAEIETDLSAEIGNSKVFSAQNQVVSKKKRSSPKLRLIFWPKSEIQRFFPPKIRWSPKKKKKKKKKKKRSSPKLRLIFRPNSEIQTFEGGLFSYGGAIFNFSQKSASKALKTCDFAYEPPPPPGYATALQEFHVFLYFLMDS